MAKLCDNTKALMPECRGSSPRWVEEVISLSPSLIFLLSTDSDLSGILKLALRDLSLVWRL